MNPVDPGVKNFQIANWHFTVAATESDGGWTVGLFAYDVQTGATHSDRLTYFVTLEDAMACAVEECGTFADLSYKPRIPVVVDETAASFGAPVAAFA